MSRTFTSRLIFSIIPAPSRAATLRVPSSSSRFRLFDKIFLIVDTEFPAKGESIGISKFLITLPSALSSTSSALIQPIDTRVSKSITAPSLRSCFCRKGTKEPRKLATFFELRPPPIRLTINRRGSSAFPPMPIPVSCISAKLRLYRSVRRSLDLRRSSRKALSPPLSA